MAVGRAHGVIQVPAKDGGHETIQACKVRGCGFVCTSKAESARHLRCLHGTPVAASSSGDARPEDPYDPSGVAFSLTGAEPVLPSPKRKREHYSDDDEAEDDELGVWVKHRSVD